MKSQSNLSFDTAGFGKPKAQRQPAALTKGLSAETIAAHHKETWRVCEFPYDPSSHRRLITHPPIQSCLQPSIHKGRLRQSGFIEGQICFTVKPFSESGRCQAGKPTRRATVLNSFDRCCSPSCQSAHPQPIWDIRCIAAKDQAEDRSDAAKEFRRSQRKCKARWNRVRTAQPSLCSVVCIFLRHCIASSARNIGKT